MTAIIICAATTAFSQRTAQDWIEKGYALRQPNGDYSPPELAVYYFSKAVEASRNDAGAYAVLAQVYLQIQQYQDALKAIDQAIKLEPRRGSHYATRSDAYYGLRQLKEACVDIKKSCELGDQGACARTKSRC